jgi:hypothetical protein
VRLTTLAALTAVIAIGGHFAQKPGDRAGAIKVTVGVTAYTFGLLIFGQIDDTLAMAFAVLVLITVLMYYGVAINKRLSFLGAK